MKNWISAIASRLATARTSEGQQFRPAPASEFPHSCADHDGLPASIGFDPAILFERAAAAPLPQHRAPMKGFIRGPLAADADWKGRSPVLPMSRKVRCTSGSSNLVGLVGSSKMNGMLGTESGGESALGRILDFAANVHTVRTQGEKIWYRLDGKSRRTTPDFVVDLYGAPTHVIEYKPAERAIRPDMQRRTAALQAVCRERGMVYGILTERFAREQPRLRNVGLLRRYRGVPILLGDWERLRSALHAGPRSIGALASQDQLSLQQIYAAIYAGLLACDISLPLSRAALVWLP